MKNIVRESELRALGIPEPWTIGLADRVRFSELDVLGHVNNTAYLSWFENFRISYFKDYGFSDYSGPFPRIVLRQIGADFISELKLNDDYIVTGITTAMRSSSFRMEYAVWSGGALRATGWAVLVSLTQQAVKETLSTEFRNTLIKRDNARQD